MLSKEELNTAIREVQNGSHVAFERLYDAYSPAMYGISLKILLDRDLAAEAVQDAFIKIWKNIHSFDVSKGLFFTWILNINRNTAIDKYRKIAKTTLIPI